MAIYKFSKNTTGWTQDNKLNTDAVFSATKNIDLSDGVPKLAKRMTAFQAVSTSGSEFDRVSQITKGLNSSGSPLFYYGTTDQFHYGSPGSVTKENSSGYGAGSSGYGVFVQYWDGYIWTANGASISRLNYATGTWSVAISSLSYTVNHPMCVSPGNALCIADKFQIAQRTTGGTFTGSKLVLPSFYEITWLMSDNVRVYIGTRNITGGQAKMFIWDGTSSSYTSEHTIEYPISVWGVIRDGEIYQITGDGSLQKFDGLGFDEVASLASHNNKDLCINYADGLVMGSPSSLAVSENGIYVAINNVFYDARSASSSRASDPAMSLGIYEYIEGVGLYHKYAPNYSTSSTSPVDFGQTGTSGGTNHALLNLERSDIAGSISLNQYAVTGGDVIMGARLEGDSTTSSFYVACAATTGRNIGYLTTKKIYPDSVDEIFSKVIIKYRNCFSANSSIKMKYRTKQRQGLPMNTQNITWTGTSVYTSTNAGHQYVLAGDEFQLANGRNAGKITTISSITESAGTYTVTLTDAIRDGSSSTTSGYSMIDYWESIPNGTLTGSAGASGQWEVSIPHKNQGAFLELHFTLDGDEQITIDEVVVVTTTNRPYAK